MSERYIGWMSGPQSGMAWRQAPFSLHTGMNHE